MITCFNTLTTDQTVHPIQQVEIFKLQGTSTLTLSANDVLSLGGSNATTMAAYGAATGKVQLVVEATGTDAVVLTPLSLDNVTTNGVVGNTGLAGVWSDAGTTTIGSTSYRVFNHSTTDAQVLVSGGANVNPSGTTSASQTVAITGVSTSGSSASFVEEFNSGTSTVAANLLNAASPPTYTTTSSANTLATKITTGAWEISTVDQWVSWQANNSRVTVNELKLKTGAMTPANATSTSIDTMMGTDSKLQLGLDGNENSTGSNDPRIYTFKSQAGPFSSVTFKSFGLNNLIYGTGLTTSTWTYPQIAFYDQEGNVVHRQEFLTLNSSTKLDVFTSTLPAGVTATSFGFMTLNADRWFIDEISMTPASNSEVGSAGTTADTTPFISGTYAITLNAGDVVQIFDGTTYLGDATIDASTKTWTYQVSTTAAAGSHAYVAKIVNAGTTVSTSNSYTVNMVAPVALDLNGDGQIGYSQIQMDLNADGVLDTTSWVSAQDGLLVHDAHGDGSVRSTSQFAFARHAGETDLQGLAAQFDSNHDGVLNALDAQFGEMAVWQDANQNGVADAGEVKHLAELGIHAIQLTSDCVVRTPTAGVTESGHSSAQLANGSDMLVADAAFAFQAPQAADVLQAAGNALTFKAADTVVDLASFVAHNASGSVAQVDLTGTGDNTLRLSLSDVLQQATASGQALQVKGNAGDVVELFTQGTAPVQTSSTLNGRDYAAFDLDRNGSVDLLVDQAVRVSLG